MDPSSSTGRLTAGTTVGTYTIERLLGAGGMGEVYLARDSRLDRPVALKLLPADLSADPDRRTRFEREAKMAAALRHPHICTIFEVGESDGRPFIAMEHVEGTTLADRIAVDLFSVKETLDIAIQIADALEEARKQHVVHRDLKSANIILTPRGDVKVLDFGLAKRAEDATTPNLTTVAVVTEAGMVIGTAAYMSPEQALGRPVDHRSDLFALGVVLYELLTGRRPFAGKTSMELFNAILNSAPAPIPRFNENVPDALVRVVAKLLEKNRELRYQSAREVVTDLRTTRDEEPATADRVASSRAPRAAGRRRFVWVAVALAAVTVAASPFLWGWLTGPSSTPVPDVVSILVLPAEVPGSPQFEQYQDALPNALANYLKQIGGLVIKGPPSHGEFERVQGNVAAVVDAYGGATHTIKMIARVEGGRITVTVRLNTADAREFVWGQEYTDAQENYPALTRRIAEGVRQELRPRAAGITPVSGLTMVAAAEREYLEGMFYWDRYNQGDQSVPFHQESDFRAAKERLERAFQLDPKFAEAAARLAMLHVFKGEATSRWDDLVPEINRWAKKATDAGPQSGLAWTVTAIAAGYRPHDQDALFRLHLRGAARAPQEAMAVLSTSGISDTITLALAAGRQAVSLRPLYSYARLSVARTLVVQNNAKAARAYLEDVVKRDPAAALVVRDVLIEILADLGETQEARKVLAEIERDVAAGRRSQVHYRAAELKILIADGRHSVAELTEFVSGSWGPEWFPETPLALLGRRGDLEGSFFVLAEASRFAMPADFMFMVSDPRLEPLRQDPRFAGYREQSRKRLVEVVNILTDAKANNELPAFFEQPLRELQAVLAQHPATPSR